MTTKNCVLLLALPPLLLLIPEVRAQEIPSPYRFVETRQEAAFFVGTAGTATGALELGPRSGDLVGLRYILEFGSALGLDVKGSWLFSSRQVFDPRRDIGDEVIGEAQIDVAEIDVRMKLNLTGHRSWNRFQPFLAFGGGLAFEALEDRTLEEAADFLPADVYDFGTRLTAAAGAGLAIHLSDRLVLRGEAGFNLWKIEVPRGFLDASRDIPLDQSQLTPEEWVSVRSISVGLGWRF